MHAARALLAAIPGRYDHVSAHVRRQSTTISYTGGVRLRRYFFSENALLVRLPLTHVGEPLIADTPGAVPM